MTASPKQLPATHVMMMEVASERYDQVLRETAADARAVAARVAGLISVDLFGTDDRTHVLLVSEWVDDVAWAKAQWDDVVQDAVVARFTSARCVHSRLYRRIVLDDGSLPAR